MMPNTAQTRNRKSSSAHYVVLFLLALLLAAANLEIALGYHLGTFGAIPGLASCLIAPTVMLRPTITRALGDAASGFAASTALAVLGLMILGLVVDSLYFVGLRRPLSAGPIIIGLDVSLLILGVVLSSYERVHQRRWRIANIPEHVPAARGVLLLITSLLATILGLSGAVRLNNGYGDGVSMVALALVLLVITAIMALGPYFSEVAAAVAFFFVSAAIQLETSMRGWLLSGGDSQTEYLVYAHVAQLGRWTPHIGDNAYVSCLSITILPRVLSQASSMSAFFVWKAVLPVLFSLTTVVVWRCSKRFLGYRLSAVAAVAYMIFPAFVYSLEFVTRQEVAFLFASLSAFLLLSRPTVPRLAVLGCTILGVVFSHYSTAYYFVAMLVIAKVAQVAVESKLTSRVPLLRKIPKLLLGTPKGDGGGNTPETPWTTRAFKRSVPAGLLLFTLGTTAIWDGVVNSGTGVDFSRVASNAIHGQSVTSEASPEPGEIQGEPVGVRNEGGQALAPFVAVERNKAAQHPGAYYGDALLQGYSVAQATSADAPVTSLGRDLRRAGFDPSGFNASLRAGLSDLYEALVVIGVAILLLRRESRNRPLLYLGVSNLLLVLLVDKVPALTASYGSARAFQQALFVLAPCIAVSLGAAARMARFRFAKLAIGGGVTFSAFSLVGLLPQITGGYVAQVGLNQEGNFSASYVTTQQELAALGWLNQKQLGPIQTNAPLATRIAYLTSLPIANDNYPDVLEPGAVFFADTQLTQTGIESPGLGLSYKYPEGFLHNVKSKIYANDGAQLYR